jgi:transposase-like protein
MDKLAPETIKLIRKRIEEGASNRAIARELGLHHSTPAKYRAWQTVRQTLDRDGKVVAETQVPERTPYAPLPDAVIARRSSLLDAEGNVAQQWVIEKPNAKEQLAAWQAVIDELKQQLTPIDLILPPAQTREDLLAFYPVGDHHFGMLAWRPEVGESYDVEIAEDLLASAMDHLLQTTPQCDTAIVAPLGDLFHYDGAQAVTPEHRNILDSDTRAAKMIRVVIRSIRRMIEAAARHHNHVHVIIEIGNHDLSNAIFLAQTLDVLYEDNPRITVDISPAHFHYYEFGATLLGTHHGHGVKMDKLPGIMAQDQREAWGRAKFCYWHTGHIHHDEQHDFGGVSVESHRILAPPDAYAHQLGYRHIRDMKAFIYSRKYGRLATYNANPMMWQE